MRAVPINTVESPTVILDLIYRLKIKDVMTRNVITAAKTDTLRSVQNLMKARGITGVPVAEGKRLLGVVSMDDIIRALDNGTIEEAAEDHMSRSLIVLEDDMPLSFAISYFDRYRFGRFPVLNKQSELVGILTSRDIITTLLVEMNREMERLEHQVPQTPTAPHGTVFREFVIRQFDFEHGGRASNEIKKVLKTLGIEPKTIRRVAVATFELEMNQVVHSVGGRISATIDNEKAEIIAEDSGPGIEDTKKALEPGFSTANDWIKSLGFGAGMGLPNVERVADELTIDSDPSGTRVRAVIYLPEAPDAQAPQAQEKSE